MKAKALSILVTSVHDDLLDIFTETDDTADRWETLENTFAAGDLAQKLDLTSKLHSLNMGEGTSIEEYLRMVKEIKMQLAAVKEPISEANLSRSC